MSTNVIPARKGMLWQAYEHRLAKKMRDDGASSKEIGIALGRPASSVQSKMVEMHRAWKEQQPKKFPTLSILKHSLPAFYAKGWRVLDFEGDMVTVVWPHEGEPR